MRSADSPDPLLELPAAGLGPAFSRTHYATIVVGAGPAGVMAAMHAAERGPVLLLDRHALPRRKSCGGMLHPHALAALRPYGNVPDWAIVSPRSVSFRYHDWDRDVSKATNMSFTNVDRAAFDQWLLGLLPPIVSIAAPATFVTLVQEERGITASVRVDGVVHHVTADVLVGADGARSAVRQCLYTRQAASYVTRQDLLRLEQPISETFDCIHMRSLGPDIAFSYVVPKGDIALVGTVFHPHTRRPWELQDQVIGRLRERLPNLGEAAGKESAPALCVRSPQDIVRGQGRVLLAGEAGGFISPSSGEGISWALRSGRHAGAAAAGDPEQALSRYCQLTIGLRLDLVRRLRWLPLMESSAGKYLAAFVPEPLVSHVTQGL